MVAEKRDASTDLLQRLQGYMKQHNVDFIGCDFNMRALSTVGDVFSDPEFSAPGNSFLWGLGALEEQHRERTRFLIMPKRPCEWRVDDSIFVAAGIIFFERFEFLVCSKFNRTQCGRTCACAAACLCPHNSISNVMAHVTIHDDNLYIYIYIYIKIFIRDVAEKTFTPLWKVKGSFNRTTWKVSDVRIVRKTWVLSSLSVSLSLYLSVSLSVSVCVSLSLCVVCCCGARGCGCGGGGVSGEQKGRD